MDKEYPVRPYSQWSTDPDQRWVHAANTFGAHLMKRVDAAVAKVLVNASAPERELADKVAITTLFTMMEILDGYYDNAIDTEHAVQYSLIGRIIDNDGSNAPCESIELAPDGDGLGLGLWGWRKGDFGQTY